MALRISFRRPRPSGRCMGAWRTATSGRLLFPFLRLLLLRSRLRQVFSRGAMMGPPTHSSAGWISPMALDSASRIGPSVYSGPNYDETSRPLDVNAPLGGARIDGAASHWYVARTGRTRASRSDFLHFLSLAIDVIVCAKSAIWRPQIYSPELILERRGGNPCGESGSAQLEGLGPTTSTECKMGQPHPLPAEGFELNGDAI